MEHQNAVGLNILMINSELLIMVWCHIKETKPRPSWCYLRASWDLNSLFYFPRIFHCSGPVCCISLSLCLCEGSPLNLSLCLYVCPYQRALLCLYWTAQEVSHREGMENFTAIINRTLQGIKSMTTTDSKEPRQEAILQTSLCIKEYLCVTCSFYKMFSTSILCFQPVIILTHLQIHMTCSLHYGAEKNTHLRITAIQ